jgi:serine protease Do
MTPALARVLLGRDDPAGVLIVSVEPTGPTANELMVGDVLLSVGSTAVTIATLGKIAVHLVPGSTVNVSVMRDGNELPRVVTAGQLPDPPEESLQAGGPDTWVPNLELGVAKSTPDIRKALKAPDESGGLVVTQLRHDGAGALAGMKVGDLITHAGTKRLENVADLSTVSKPSVSQPLLLRIIRNGSPGFIAVTGTDEH